MEKVDKETEGVRGLTRERNEQREGRSNFKCSGDEEKETQDEVNDDYIGSGNAGNRQGAGYHL